MKWYHHIDGLVQDCSNSIANALELLQSCTKPSTFTMVWARNIKPTHAYTGTHHGHYSDVTVGMMASQITSFTIVYSPVYSGADQRKHQSSASLAFVRGIHRWPLNSPHKWPVTRKIFPFDDVIMSLQWDPKDTRTPSQYSALSL